MRTAALLALRPLIEQAVVSENMTSEEQFQNGILRPILKLQHPLLVQVVRQHILKKKAAFFESSITAQQQYIEQLFRTDNKLKTLLKGIVLGQFTIEEYKKYCEQSSALNKRMMTMLKKRILDSVEELQAVTL